MSEQLKDLREKLGRLIDEKFKPANEVLEEIVTVPINFDFTMTNSEAMHRIRQLALICRILLETADVHQTEIARLIVKLEALQNK